MSLEGTARQYHPWGAEWPITAKAPGFGAIWIKKSSDFGSVVQFSKTLNDVVSQRRYAIKRSRPSGEVKDLPLNRPNE
jgi:hypothetical protein